MSDANQPDISHPDPELVPFCDVDLHPLDDESIELVAAHLEPESLFCQFVSQLGTDITPCKQVNDSVRINLIHIQVYNALPTRARGLKAAIEGLATNFRLKKLQPLMIQLHPLSVYMSRHFLHLLANGVVLTTDNRRLYDHFFQRAAEDQNKRHEGWWRPYSVNRRLLPGGRWGLNTEAAQQNLDLAQRFNDAEALRILGCGHLQFPPRNEITLVSDEHSVVLDTNAAIRRGVERKTHQLGRDLTLDEHAKVTIDAVRDTVQDLRDSHLRAAEMTRKLHGRATLAGDPHKDEAAKEAEAEDAPEDEELQEA